MVARSTFEWDKRKDRENQRKHGVSFAEAQHAFLDDHRLILEDVRHSRKEARYYCVGRVADGILTVRFTYRGSRIRIYGAGYWRKGKQIYEERTGIQ